MKIIKASEIKGHQVETDEDRFNEYIRYGPDSWFITMGDSDEPLYACEKIEELFQEYIAKKS